MAEPRHILVSERGVTLCRGTHSGATGLANAIVYNQEGVVEYKVELTAGCDAAVIGAEVNFPAADLRVTGAVDPDFELECIDDEKGGGRYLCRWMATLMSPKESAKYEGERYTMNAVPDSSIGRYRVVEWEPTWEKVQPSKEALDVWCARKAALSQEQATTPLKRSCDELEEDTTTVAKEDAQVATSAAMAAAAMAAAVATTTKAQSQVATTPTKTTEAKAALPAASPATAAGVAPIATASPSTTASIAVYGAVCTVWQPHMLWAFDIDAASSPARSIFASSSGCMQVLLERPSFVWLSVNSGAMDRLSRGMLVDGLLDAYPGEAIDSIHPSRRGTSKVVAFGGTATLANTVGSQTGSGGVPPGFTVSLDLVAPSSELSAKCRRQWAPHLPYQVPPFEGQASFRLLITPSGQPYLTRSNSARPNTPRCKVSVSLVLRQNSQYEPMLAQAAKAALEVCSQADQMQMG